MEPRPGDDDCVLDTETSKVVASDSLNSAQDRPPRTSALTIAKEAQLETATHTVQATIVTALAALIPVAGLSGGTI